MDTSNIFRGGSIGQTTPMTVARKPAVRQPVPTMSPITRTSAAPNAQNIAMQQSLNKNRQVQKVYGVPVK